MAAGQAVEFKFVQLDQKHGNTFVAWANDGAYGLFSCSLCLSCKRSMPCHDARVHASAHSTHMRAVSGDCNLQCSIQAGGELLMDGVRVQMVDNQPPGVIAGALRGMPYCN